MKKIVRAENIGINRKPEVINMNESTRKGQKKLVSKRWQKKQGLLLVGIIIIVALVGMLKNAEKMEAVKEADNRQIKVAEEKNEKIKTISTVSCERVYTEFYMNHMPQNLEDSQVYDALEKLAGEYPEFQDVYENRENYPIELLAALCNNPEMLAYVEGYAKYRNGDKTVAGQAELTTQEKEKRFPLFLQWDKQWGYEEYGDFNIALSGCGPTCLSMVLVAQNRDFDMTPDKVADFAMENNFYVEGTGTAWSLMTDGARQLGLEAKEISLDESVMKNQLDMGKMMICSVRPGDFTALGHFIVIYGYDDNGFLVNDPNNIYRSNRSWTYEELASQIRILWSY